MNPLHVRWWDILIWTVFVVGTLFLIAGVFRRATEPPCRDRLVRVTGAMLEGEPLPCESRHEVRFVEVRGDGYVACTCAR